jgi:hypothetical protein
MATPRPNLADALEEEVFRSAGGDMVFEQLGGFAPHAGQRAFLDSRALFRLLIAHRRWGKNWACIFDAWNHLTALRRQDRPLLNPRVVVWFVFPTYPLAEELWDDLKRMVPRSEVVRSIESKPMAMELRGDVHISLHSAEHPNDLVSAGIDLLYMIEIARMKAEAWWTIRPTLTSHGRLGMVVWNTTPFGGNWVAGTWREYLAGAHPEWAGWLIPAFDADGNRHPDSIIPDTDRLLQERAEMPERWYAQEFLCSFLSNEGAVFPHVRDRVAGAPASPRPPLVVGADLAKQRDFSVFAVFDADGRMVDCERLGGIAYTQQAERLASLVERWGAKTTVVESNGPGEPFYEMLEATLRQRAIATRLVPFATTAQTKRGMIDALVIAFERGTISLLDDSVLVNEFEAFSMLPTRSGQGVRFAASEGFHDDCVMACALAWTEVAAAAQRRSEPMPKPEDLMRVRRPGRFAGLGGGPGERWAGR